MREAEGDAVEDVVLADHQLSNTSTGLQLLSEHRDNERTAGDHVNPAGMYHGIISPLLMR